MPEFREVRDPHRRLMVMRSAVIGWIMVFDRIEFVPDRLGVVETSGENRLPLAMCAVLLSAVGISVLDSGTVADGLTILSVGLVCPASLVSAAWIRFSCCFLGVPVQGDGFGPRKLWRSVLSR